MNGSQLYEQNTQQEELKTNKHFFTLPVAYFARIIDFRSYIDATMSLYSITLLHLVYIPI